MKEGLKWFFDQMYVAITHKKPCKTCLVRPCCSENCEQVVMFEYFYWRYDEMAFKRFNAWAIIWSICMLAIPIIKILSPIVQW